MAEPRHKNNLSQAAIQVLFAQHDGRLRLLEEKAERAEERHNDVMKLRLHLAEMEGRLHQKIAELEGRLNTADSRVKWALGLLTAIFLALLVNIFALWRGP